MDMRFDGVNYFAADARLHYGSVSIKDGYIDRVDMADAAQMRLNAIVKFCKALGGGWQRGPDSA